ncbi:MAG: hypothetical protein Q8P42_02990 [Gallionella sp.]|nr:hypothetical protein [Gallionella sp.]
MTEKLAIRILALDDEPLMLKLFGRILSMPDFAGAIARPGNYPDLILPFWREEQPIRA